MKMRHRTSDCDLHDSARLWQRRLPYGWASKRRGHAFTLVELLVVIAIIAMLVTVLLPAVQAMRGTARRAQCQNQLLQLIMAAQHHEMAHQHFPAGVTDHAPGPIRNVPEGHHHGWMIALLPYLDERNVHRQVDSAASVYDAVNEQVRSHTIPKFLCPTDWSSQVRASSSYAACHHGQEAPIDDTNNGVFFLNSRVMADDVLDGLSQTVFMGEKRLDGNDLGWVSGTRATLRNTGSPINRGRGVMPMPSGSPQEASEAPDPLESDSSSTERAAVKDAAAESARDTAAPGEATASAAADQAERVVGGFGSSHQGGAHIAFGDGRIQFMTQQVDPRVLQLLGNRDDGTLLSVEDYRE